MLVLPPAHAAEGSERVRVFPDGGESGVDGVDYMRLFLGGDVQQRSP